MTRDAGQVDVEAILKEVGSLGHKGTRAHESAVEEEQCAVHRFCVVVQKVHRLRASTEVLGLHQHSDVVVQRKSCSLIMLGSTRVGRFWNCMRRYCG